MHPVRTSWILASLNKLLLALAFSVVRIYTCMLNTYLFPLQRPGLDSRSIFSPHRETRERSRHVRKPLWRKSICIFCGLGRNKPKNYQPETYSLMMWSWPLHPMPLKPSSRFQIFCRLSSGEKAVSRGRSLFLSWLNLCFSWLLSKPTTCQESKGPALCFVEGAGREVRSKILSLGRDRTGRTSESFFCSVFNLKCFFTADFSVTLNFLCT